MKTKTEINVTKRKEYKRLREIKKAVADILHILKKPTKTYFPTVITGDKFKQSFKEIAHILHNNKIGNLPPLPTKATQETTQIIPCPQKICTQIKSKITVPITPPPPRVQISLPSYDKLMGTKNQRPVIPVPPRVQMPLLSKMPLYRTQQLMHPDAFPSPAASLPKIHPNIGFYPILYQQQQQYTPIQQWFAQHMFDTAGKKLNLDALLKGPNKLIWQQAVSNELGRLAIGIPGKVKGTKAIS